MKKNNNKIGICTLFTGYNFGSALQAYATKILLNNMGYNPHIVKLTGSLVQGRDIRINKAICTFVRMMLYSKNKSNALKSFTENKKTEINQKTINEFNEFYNKRLSPYYVQYKQLKKESAKLEWLAFICGSDQIWNSTAFYVDPFYYLRFAPENKRVAYAPSFGRTYVPKYNQKKITKYLKEIKHISVREKSGKKLVKQLTGKTIDVCLDPTLLLSKKEWNDEIRFRKVDDDEYILCYFLSKPSSRAEEFIKKVSEEHKCKVVFMNKAFGEDVVYCGPEDFLSYIDGAKMIITDSFHGVAFSVNFNKQFFVFNRQYLTEDQSTRIKSLLEIADLLWTFDYSGPTKDLSFDYSRVNKNIDKERKKSISFLKTSLKEINYEK